MTQKKQEVKKEQYLKDQKMLGYVGECYVRLELAKRGVYSQRMHKDFLQDYDLLLSSGLMVEVKTSSVVNIKDKRGGRNSSRDIWQFTNYKRIEGGKMVGRFRECDFFILVGMDHKSKPLKYFIVPSAVIGSRQGITMPLKRKVTKEFSIDQFEDKWESVTC